jgi:germination protein M
MSRLRPLFTLVVAVGLLAACAASGGPLGTVPGASSSPDASVGQGSPDVTPGSSSPSPSALVQPSDSPTTGPSPAGTTIVRAYFLLAGPTGSEGLVPTLATVPQTKAVSTAAMTALLTGSAIQGARFAQISSAIPAGTTLLSLSIAGGVATVDLSSEFQAGGGSASVVGRLGQVVYTLTQFPTVKSVVIEVGGQKVTGPGSRVDYADLLPAIFVDRPAFGAAPGNLGRITGSADVFEAAFRATLVDSKGATIADQQVMATCGTGCRGTFDTTLSYVVTKAQWGTLRVWDASAKDGSPENVREYPVWLTPAG